MELWFCLFKTNPIPFRTAFIFKYHSSNLKKESDLWISRKVESKELEMVYEATTEEGSGSGSDDEDY